MSNKLDSLEDHAPITGRGDLLHVFEAGSKPRNEWRIGTEHEKFVFRLRDRQAPSWEEEGGIRDLLLGFRRFGWAPLEENGKVIAMTGPDGSLSLEPAGQLELSGAAVSDLHATRVQNDRHHQQCEAIGRELGLGYLALGMTPEARREDQPVMPKGRYDIMLRYMPKVGSLGLDMMLRTCTIQTNLDYGSEADMVAKMRVGLALQPVVTAIFANSPFTEGRPNGFLSFRSHVWTDTDRARTGMLPFVFEDGFGFERYADYALDVPMYFVYRDGRYIDVAGQSFRRFLEGRLEGLEGVTPTVGDWNDHLSTIFPEVRMKSFLEMRGADMGRKEMITALPAFWVGLLYDERSLAACLDIIRPWTAAARDRLRQDAPRHGLKAPAPDGREVLALARELLQLAEAGLERRNLRNEQGETEAVCLEPIRALLETGETQAEHWLQRFHGPWQGSVGPIWGEAAC